MRLSGTQQKVLDEMVTLEVWSHAGRGTGHHCFYRRADGTVRHIRHSTVEVLKRRGLLDLVDRDWRRSIYGRATK